MLESALMKILEKAEVCALLALVVAIQSNFACAETGKKAQNQKPICNGTTGISSDEILILKGKAIETKQLGKEAAGLLVLWTYADCLLLMQRRVKSGVEAYRVTRSFSVSDTDYRLKQEKIVKGGTIYSKACEVCHVSGVAGAPQTGNKAVWSEKTKAGLQQLYKSTLLGKGAMPAKGGATQLTDEDVRNSVDFMLLVAN
jgi:cytochrome c5